MSEFIEGQRWVVDSEPELGLGIVTMVEGRTVNIYFAKGDCERTYAKQQAPLTRIRFSIEDEVKTTEAETVVVTAVHTHNGLYFYETPEGKIIPETSLDSEIQLNQPFMRLMTGQLDTPHWFSFKRQLSGAVSRVWQSQLNGLLGVRANLIAHQLYVAWEACNREKVRVLLADEVGLGKTIEAGMIMSRLVKLERIQKSLVVVPQALQVQWLVELVRRFSLSAELFKDEDHDFNSGQLHIISHEIFTAKYGEIANAEFDLLVVDEAHHLTPGSQSFAALESLTQHVDHLVLLTATPEQLGIDSHFARLQLLEPAKFPRLEKFIAQEERYIKLNQDIKKLPASRGQIIKNYQLELKPSDTDDGLIAQLLDSHGIGRVMFRNVRSAVTGFPRRIAVPHVIPEDTWVSKFEWLSRWLTQHRNEKTLVICHHVEDVFACEDYLWKKHGIDAAVFHEQQSLVDRDRAAAYFSDSERGSQVLICSEIGSEGRNFQFSANLICLDLPDHPDLMEQRIGRLDRIGQTQDVKIHIPVCEGSKTQRVYIWYHEILSCIEQQNPAAACIHDEFWPQLQNSLKNRDLVETASQKMLRLREDIANGRDALLELNSCRQPFANQLARKIAEFEEHTPQHLVEMASELLHFYFEEIRQDVYSIIPSDKMLIPSLPGIPPEGCEITFHREIANHREDLRFISWDAPLVLGLWELLHYSEIGTASVAMMTSRQLPEGHCLLESCFDLVIQSEYHSACRPFLDAITVRSLTIDISDNDLSNTLPENALQNSLQTVKRHLAQEIIKSKKDEIPAWFVKCEQFAEVQKDDVVQRAIESAQRYFGTEIDRLTRLRERYQNVEESEIQVMREKSANVLEALRHNVHLHLSAIRLIVVAG